MYWGFDLYNYYYICYNDIDLVNVIGIGLDLFGLRLFWVCLLVKLVRIRVVFILGVFLFIRI